MLIRSLALTLVSSLLVSGALARAPEMVQPESLDQGFVLIVDDLSGMANKDNPIDLASSINGWNPKDEQYILSGRSDTRWQIIVDHDFEGATLQFKFTLGGWDREELDGSGNAIGNRMLPKIDKSRLRPGERPVIELTIPEFRVPVPLSEQVRASGIYRELDVTGTVRRLEVRGGAGGAQAMTRDLLVWLPPGYDEPRHADRAYPVLYMFDGQNLFEQLPGVPGEWHADETATELIESGRIEELIIVGIPHAGEHRIREYMPSGGYPGIEGDGAACLEWVVREVMPRVERAFRVKTGRAHTAIGGASLGGAMALYASTEMPDRFGRAIIESLPLRLRGGLLSHLRDANGWPEKVFVGVGGKEVSRDASDSARNRLYAKWGREVSGRFAERIGAGNTEFVLEQDAVHNEDAWSSRFDDALVFLFPGG